MSDAVVRTVVGLEVHVQLLTATKLFCGCPTTFGKPANTQTCPVCNGMPGVLPVLNRRAFELGLKAAVAVNGDIEWNDTTDVISGSAGIGLFLLYAAETLDAPEACTLAARAGRRLLERSRDEAGGRKWPMDGT